MSLDWSRHDLRQGKTVLTTIDAHAAGEPLRIVTGGLPELPGKTMLERRRYLRDHLDQVRQMLMFEPRGHFNMYGCVVTPPVSAAADLGVLFLHNEGYSTMCGHGIIALVTALLETGALPGRGPQTPVAIDTPAGLIRATAHLAAGGKVEKVSFRNVPSFLYRRDLSVAVPGMGTLPIDIAFGGAFYAILPAAAVKLCVGVQDLPALVAAAAAIKNTVAGPIAIEHPEEKDLGFLYGVIFTDRAQDPSHHSRNLCVFADGEVDRSPTGTGVSARLALHYSKGEIRLGQTIAIESMLGKASVFTSRAVEVCTCGSFAAIIPEVSGRAFLTGKHEFILDPADPLGSGFLLK